MNQLTVNRFDVRGQPSAAQLAKIGPCIRSQIVCIDVVVDFRTVPSTAYIHVAINEEGIRFLMTPVF